MKYLQRNLVGFTLLVFILITIVIIVMSIFNAGRLNQQNITKASVLKESETGPAIALASSILFKKFQKSIYGLMVLKKTYLAHIDDLTLSSLHPFNEPNSNLYPKILMNNFELTKVYSTYVQNKTKDEQWNILTWFINQNVTSLNQTSLIQALHLSGLIHTLPLMRTLFEQNHESIEERIDFFYLCNRKSEVIVFYPLQSESYYQTYVYRNNPEHCRTRYNVYPSYYYFACRDWYNQIEIQLKEDKSNEQELFISHPYLFNGFVGVYGITVCLVFDDPLAKKFPSSNIIDYENKIFFCLDLRHQNLLNGLENINKNLSGYFFVLPLRNINAIFYPRRQSQYYTDLTRDEYTLTDYSFIDEVYDFTYNILPIMNHKYNEEDLMFDAEDYLRLTPYVNSKLLNRNSFIKNNKEHKFKIFPVFMYNTESDFTKKSNVLNLIYVYGDNDSKSIIVSNQDGKMVYIRMIAYALVFCIFAIMVYVISYDIVKKIALRIVNPVKAMIYFSMKNAKLKESISNMNEYSNQSQEKTKSIDYDNDDNDTEENEQLLDSFTNNSPELDKLFDLVFELKNSFTFSSRNLSVSLVDLISSKTLYEKIQNKRRLNVSRSNLGNYVLNLRKYDKCILSLNKALYDREDNDNDRHEGEIEETMNLSSRYPKMIYSMKKFNKLLKDISDKDKRLLNEYRNNLYLFDQLVDISFEKKTKLGKILKEYLTLAKKIKNYKRQCDALNEISQYKYSQLKEQLFIVNQSQKETNSNANTNKGKQLLKSLSKAFSEFECIFNEYLEQTNELECKNLTIVKISEYEIELSNLVLYQRHLYIQGKVAFICGDYVEAFRLFTQVSNDELLLSNAKISKNALKYMLYILNLPPNNHNNKSQPVINHINERIKSFEFLSRDIMIQIQITQEESFINNESKVNKIASIISQIFNQYLNKTDRIGIIITNQDQSYEIILQLTYRDSESVLYIDSLINHIKKVLVTKINDDCTAKANRKDEEKKSDYINICRLVSFTYQYVQKKTIDKRKLMLIVFTGYFNDYSLKSDEEKVQVKSMMKIIKQSTIDMIPLDLVIIGDIQDKTIIPKLNVTINSIISENSTFIHSDNLSSIIKLFKRQGEISRSRFFNNEEY